MRASSLLAATTALTMMGGAALADFTLVIAHTNDVHSRIEPINRFDSTCNAEDDAEGKCFGGAARIKTMVDQLRAEHDNILVLDAGDPFQGSLFYTTYKGAAAAEFMEAIGYDAMAVGNHEFDDGPAALGRFIDAVSFPVLSGNLSVSQDPELNGKVGRTAVLSVGGEQVGIVTALATDTVETSSPGPRVVFSDEIESLQQQVEELTAQGIDKIIAVTHVGFAKDLEIAQNVSGIDAIVGGHSHTWFGRSPDADVAYPYWASGPNGELVPIVQAYAYSKFVGELTLEFDDAGEVKDAYGDTILLDASVVPDPAISARVAEMAAPIEELKNQPVSMTSAAIEGDRSVCRAMECAMGNLVADAMLERVKDQGISIAIQNGGGLRASIDEGQILMGEVLTVLPFQNTLATFQLPGSAVIAALENGVSRVEDGAGRFPQVSGLRFVWDAAAAPGSRIVSVEVMGDSGWTAIDEDAIYGVVSNNYMRNGGDGYAMFRDQAINAYDFGPGLEQVVADYLEASGTYTPYTDGRISQN
ncbi:5'-nucleotidase [Rubricella aquisinus]|uniref:5'-nucleotidase n=1 Tax=Rubricella aquisinus TaxID=2028108 RepID=A0A840WLP1_9RHOB|nr:bifunctional metallophosphatase/5'-nucleotidase [Rubricella aquisinus]MBB5516008.1 5'-nucleotidase [Rubricella aquisinus]